VARDGGCAFNGCGRPPEWTEAHHVVHHDGWAVELIDGVVHVIPPPWVDPEQQPRPNTNPQRAGHLSTLPTPPGHDRR
jgi:hypothetical protein